MALPGGLGGRSEAGAGDEEGEAEEEYAEVDEFRADVLFVERGDAVDEADYHAASAYHGDHGNHRAFERERIEVGNVGGGQEYGDAWYGPAPAEFAFGRPGSRTYY